MPANTDRPGVQQPTAEQVLDALGCAVVVLDKDGIIRATNAYWHEAGGGVGGIGDRYLDAQRASGSQDLDLVLEEGIGRVLRGRSLRFELEYPVEGPLGRRWHLLVATPVEGTGSAVVAHVDVTAHHDVQDILDARAHRDPLTGLPNRRAMTERLGNAINRGRREGTPTSVVFLDLDGFKAVNDGLGHDVGDEVLAAVGRRLAGTIRADDVLGRWGGDEFVVVVNAGGEQAVTSLAGRLHAALAQPVAVSEHRTVHLGVSVGAAEARDGDAPDDVLARADMAMFEAKRTRRSLVFAGRESDGSGQADR